MKVNWAVRRFQGYSFIEVLFSLSVFALLLSVGVFSFSQLLQKNEEQCLLDELKTAIHYAKLQAVAQNQVVFLTALDSMNWAKGMTLQIGKNNLYRWKWQYGQWQLTWKGVRSSKGLFFSPNPSQTMSNGRFYLSHPQQKNGKTVILNRMGRIKVVP